MRDPRRRQDGVIPPAIAWRLVNERFAFQTHAYPFVAVTELIRYRSSMEPEISVKRPGRTLAVAATIEAPRIGRWLGEMREAIVRPPGRMPMVIN